MPLDKGLLVLRVRKYQKNLKVWQRILINLYILGGYETPIKMAMLTDACYNFELTPKMRWNLNGTVLRTAEKLRVNGNLKRYNNPVRYQLVCNKHTLDYLAHIARKLGFPNAKPEDFL